MLLFLLFAPLALAELGGYKETPERKAIMRELQQIAGDLDERSIPCENLDQLSKLTYGREVPEGCPELQSQIGKIREMDRDYRAGCHEHFSKLTSYIRDPNLCGPSEDWLRMEFHDWDTENRKLHQSAMNEFDIKFPSETEVKKDHCNFAWNIVFNGRKKIMGLYSRNRGTSYAYFEDACSEPKPGERTAVENYLTCMSTGEGC